MVPFQNIIKCNNLAIVMNVLHINTWSIGSGAPIAAKRHCEAMVRCGINASILYLEKKQASDVNYFFEGGFDYKLFRIKRFLIDSFVRNIKLPDTLWSCSLLDNDITQMKVFKDADIVYLHWVCGQFLSPKSIERMLKTGKPIVWYMHDMFPFTGGCHYSYECEKYKSSCGNCPQLSKFKLFSKKQLDYKIQHLAAYENLVISAPSQWLLDISKESQLFRNHMHFVCRNLIDEKVFYKRNRKTVLQEHGLDESKRYILLSVYSTKLKYKGFQYLLDALQEIKIENTVLLIMGNVPDKTILPSLGLPYHLLGYLSTTEDVAKAYSMADVLVIPSILENYPNVIIEAFACQLPVVAFNVGGIPEQVIHKKTGWLAQMKSSHELAEGVMWVLNNSIKYHIGENCLKYFQENCSYSSMWKNHQPLFNLIK